MMRFKQIPPFYIFYQDILPRNRRKCKQLSAPLADFFGYFLVRDKKVTSPGN